MIDLILASSSPSRLRLLKSAGIKPTVLVSGVNEEAEEFDALSPSELVIALAILKSTYCKRKGPK
jgi:septum formation protein